MVVGQEIAHGHIAVAGPFDAAGTENAIGVAVEEQRQHDVGRILGVAAALVVDGEGTEGQAFDGRNDEVDQIILGHPVAQVRRQKQRRLAVDVLEAVRHISSY